jgi:hypothetical protein
MDVEARDPDDSCWDLSTEYSVMALDAWLESGELTEEHRQLCWAVRDRLQKEDMDFEDVLRDLSMSRCINDAFQRWTYRCAFMCAHVYETQDRLAQALQLGPPVRPRFWPHWVPDDGSAEWSPQITARERAQR